MKRVIQKVKNLIWRFLPPSRRYFDFKIQQTLSEMKTANEKLVKREVECQAERIIKELRTSDSKAAERIIAELRTSDAKEAERILAKLLAELHAADAKMTKHIAENIKNVEKYQQESRKLLETWRKEDNQLQKEQTTDLQKAIKQVEDAIPGKTVYWNNQFEKKIVMENWGDVTEASDFEEKFMKLIAGMDSKSIQTIIRILSRQKKYLNSDLKVIDLFTRAEQEEMRLLKENFDAEIFKVSEQLYAYRQYLLPVNHFESSVFYYRHGIDDLNTADSVKGKAIIDVGGYIGDSVLVLSELEPSVIYTFEAVPENYEMLQKTVELNRIENVVAENCALSAESGTMEMSVSGSSSGAIERGGINYKEKIEVPVTTLDEYVAKHNIKVGLIKVDIEGSEPFFLEGAKKTICEQKPILLLSIYHNAHDFFELKPMIESWGVGYTFKIHKPTFGSATGETLLLAEVE